jgi:hypothetical protein
MLTPWASLAERAGDDLLGEACTSCFAVEVAFDFSNVTAR